MSFSKASEFDNASANLAHLVKAFSNPCRLRILQILAKKTRCPYSILEANIPRHRSTLSKHLRFLKVRNLIGAGTDGKHTWYFLQHGPIGRLVRMVLRFFKDLDSGCMTAGALGLELRILKCWREINAVLRRPDSRAPP